MTHIALDLLDLLSSTRACDELTAPAIEDQNYGKLAGGPVVIVVVPSR